MEQFICFNRVQKHVGILVAGGNNLLGELSCCDGCGKEWGVGGAEFGHPSGIGQIYRPMIFVHFHDEAVQAAVIVHLFPMGIEGNSFIHGMQE